MNCVGNFFFLYQKEKKNLKPSIFHKAKFKKGQEWHDTCQVQRVLHSRHPHPQKEQTH